MTNQPQPEPENSVENDLGGPAETREKAGAPRTPAKEIGGRDGPEPTRYGDWEKNGRCIDF
jgi:hypothetical protein